jgi:hypothetical protein
MKTLKRAIMLTVLLGGFSAAAVPEADAQVWRPVAPARRAVLPPYPLARRAIVGPVYRPYYAYRPFYSPNYAYRPYFSPSYGYRSFYYGRPVVYGPGVRIAARW